LGFAVLNPTYGTLNPWQLHDNLGLKDELDTMIGAYIANNPIVDDNHWVLSTRIDKVVW